MFKHLEFHDEVLGTLYLSFKAAQVIPITRTQHGEIVKGLDARGSLFEARYYLTGQERTFITGWPHNNVFHIYRVENGERGDVRGLAALAQIHQALEQDLVSSNFRKITINARLRLAPIAI